MFYVRLQQQYRQRLQIVAARGRVDQNQSAGFRARRLRQELGLPYWREHVEEMVSRHRHPYGRRAWENAVHDGGTADSCFPRRQVGELNRGLAIADRGLLSCHSEQSRGISYCSLI